MKTGYAFKSSWFVPDGPVRVLRNANVHQGVIEWLDTVAMDEPSLARFKDFSLREGDIVLSLDRPIVANGLKVATVSLSDTPSLLNQRVGRFDIDTANVVPGFLYGFLRSPQFARALKGHDQVLVCHMCLRGKSNGWRCLCRRSMCRLAWLLASQRPSGRRKC